MITPAVKDPPEIEEILWRGFSKAYISFDIGANCGQSFGHILEFSDKVVAFEPSFEAVEWVEENLLFLVADRVTLIQSAISDHSGEVTLYAIPGKIDTGQLVSDVSGMEWKVQGKTFGRPVDSYSLDDAVMTFGRPDFIKIDVEGHEEKVIRGGLQTLSIVRPELLIEIHDLWQGDTIEDILYGNDYNLEYVRHPHYEVDSILWATHYWIKAVPDDL